MRVTWPPLKLTGGKIDARDEAIDVFVNFHIDPRNSWLPEGETLGDFPLVIDPACGALSGIAASVMRRLHGGEVIEVNPDSGDGKVNLNSGVADLEGLVEISSSDLRFSENQGVQQVFARQGKAAIFDADADRFFRLDYDPQSCKALLMSGDETAVTQAQYLSSSAPGKMFVIARSLIA